MDASPLEKALKQFAGKRILVVGDIMLDRFLWGAVSRISPEAPVPVVEVQREELYPGGAANVARNLLPFAGSVSIAGRAGNDADGELLLGLLADRGVDASEVLLDEKIPTTVKTRVVARNQQVVRIDREQQCPLEDAAIDQVADAIKNRLPDLDALILQDYGKGFIGQRLVDRIAEIPGIEGITITVDPNPNNAVSWRCASSIKPNRHEAFRFAGEPEVNISGPPGEDPTLERIATSLFGQWETDHLLITLGEQGMLSCFRSGERHHIPPRAHEVFDVSGAGDTAIALLTLALAAGVDPTEAAEISNWASAVVVGKLGTATLTPEELLEACTNSGHQS